MTSEIDSNSLSSDSSYNQRRKCKLHKNFKKKSEKKSKKEKKKKSHKEKKRSRKEARSSSSYKDNIQILKANAPQIMVIKNVINDAFGPALPPHLLNRNKDDDKAENLVIGPRIPKDILENLEQIPDTQKLSQELQNFSKLESEEENLQGSYGPLPVTSKREMSVAQIELEQRALELKMAAIDGISATTNEQKVREEWMLELPEVGLKTGLAALNNLKRGFHQGKEKPDFSDRSSWTKTPQTSYEKQKPTSSKGSQLEMELQAEALYEKQRDAEQEDIAKKHKKKHKREESLVELHQKKLHKEEKEKAKELKQSGAKPERRPFTRDVDLKLNKIDRNQTKQIVDKAKILNTKFATGHAKYL